MRFLGIPGLASLNAGSIALSTAKHLAAERRRGCSYDLILGAFAYPEGCAAVLLGKLLGLPTVVKCHGSDLNRVPQHHPLARLQLQQLLPRADRVVAVSQGLGRVAEELGVQRERLRVVYNGVNKERFFPRDRGAARAQLGLPADRKLALFVGHLAPHKGAEDLLKAAAHLKNLSPGAELLFIGDGPLAGRVRAAEATLPVRLIGPRPHAQIADYLAATDLLTLPSWGEGMPNVVREAHAAGRPVVATEVGGIPEAVHHPALGRLVPVKAPEALAHALAAQLSEGSDSDEILRRAEVPNWTESAAQLMGVLREAKEAHS